MNYKVEIVRIEDGEVTLSMDVVGLRKAERTKRGAEINLNHENFFVRIVDAESGEEID